MVQLLAIAVCDIECVGGTFVGIGLQPAHMENQHPAKPPCCLVLGDDEAERRRLMRTWHLPPGHPSH